MRMISGMMSARNSHKSMTVSPAGGIALTSLYASSVPDYTVSHLPTEPLSATSSARDWHARPIQAGAVYGGTEGRR